MNFFKLIKSIVWTFWDFTATKDHTYCYYIVCIAIWAHYVHCSCLYEYILCKYTLQLANWVIIFNGQCILCFTWSFEYIAFILILLSIFWNSIVNTCLLNLSHNKQQATIFCIVMSCNIMCISIISTAFYGKLILLKSSYQTKFITQSYLIQPS